MVRRRQACSSPPFSVQVKAKRCFVCRLQLQKCHWCRRASWRIMSSIEAKDESKGNENNVKLIKGRYRQKVEDELTKICKDILAIIDSHLVPHSGSGEAAVFYCKMKGDYLRYLVEFKSDDEKKKLLSNH